MSQLVLQSRLQAEIGLLLETFMGSPTKQTVLEAALLLELCFTFPDTEPARRIIGAMGNICCHAMDDGLLERLLVASPEYLYPVALFLHAASRAPTGASDGLGTIHRLIDHRLVGGSELPPMTTALAALHLQQSGFRLAAQALAPDEIAALIDRRLLRRRFDSYDVMALLMAQQLRAHGPQRECAFVLAAVMCVTSLRADQMAWLPMLALLVEHDPRCSHLASLAVHRSVLEGSSGDLLPPSGALVTDELVRTTPHGLRLRNTLALWILLSR